MAKVKEKKPLEKKNWVQNFILIGKACISDYTFKLVGEFKCSCGESFTFQDI